MKLFSVIIISFFGMISLAHAYFDPGTGAFIVQAILGFLAAVVASLTMTWTRIKLFFLRIIGKDKSVKKKEDK